MVFVGVNELRQLKSDLQHRVTQYSARLIRQLKSRDRLLLRIKRHCDVITAILQASSPKRSVCLFLLLSTFLSSISRPSSSLTSSLFSLCLLHLSSLYLFLQFNLFLHLCIFLIFLYSFFIFVYLYYYRRRMQMSLHKYVLF